MLKATKNLILPTTMVGSYPRPLWSNESLRSRSFKQAMGDSLFREQYLDTVTCIINAQESAGLDILTDGDAPSIWPQAGNPGFFMCSSASAGSEVIEIILPSGVLDCARVTFFGR